MKRKTTNADLEDKRGILFKVGLAIALLIALLIVNYKQTKPHADTVTVKVTGLEIKNADDVDSALASTVRPPELSR